MFVKGDKIVYLCDAVERIQHRLPFFISDKYIPADVVAKKTIKVLDKLIESGAVYEAELEEEFVCEYCDNLFPKSKIHKFQKYVPHRYITQLICDECNKEQKLEKHGFIEIAIP